MFPDFIEASGVLGYVAITTHSIHDILTLHRYLSDVAQMYGKLEGVPFVFGRAKREVSAPKPKETGTRMKTTKSLLYLHVLPDFTREHLARRLAAVDTPALTDGHEGARVIDMQTGEIGQTPHENPTNGSIDNHNESADFGERPDWYDEFLAKVGNHKDFRNLTTDQIAEALGAADGWRQSAKLASAAVIAYHCQYNPNTIDIYTSTEGFDPTVYELALGIAQAREAVS